MTFSRSGGCQQNSICSSSFTKDWGITPIYALAERWERLTRSWKACERWWERKEKGQHLWDSSSRICENWQGTIQKQKL